MATLGTLHSLVLTFLLIPYVFAGILAPRASGAPTCVGLSVKSNNGDRKVAIVIDSSGSMLDTDPKNLRLAAGRALNAWLITKAEASGGKKADLVTVIDFDSTAHIVYPLGDPAGANASFSKIDSSGGTYIAGGVNMAMGQLNGSSTGSTSGRSSIIVFTDGEDSDTVTLVKRINQAAAQGMRVSFGFLDPTASVQAPSVLTAITASGGVYATITTEDASNNFINFAILNGLTYNDNPQGNNNTLLAGLSISQFITGTQTISTFYNAQANEKINFTVTSITAGNLTIEALFEGKSMATNKTVPSSRSFSGYGYAQLPIQAPSAGKFEIKVTAQKAPASAVYIIGASSNQPIQNCSIAVTGGDSGGGGLGTGAKVGLGLGIPAAIAGILVGGFFLLKYFGHKMPPLKNPFAKPPPATGPTTGEPPMYYPGAEKPGFIENVIPLGSTPPAAIPPAIPPTMNGGGTMPFVPPPIVPPSNTNAQDPRHKHRIRRRKFNEGPYHHHHLVYGHPCVESQTHCALLGGVDHVCKDPEAEPKGPCVCMDKNCPLNKDDHECVDDPNVKPCGCEDEECEVTKQVQRRNTQNALLDATKMAGGQAARTFY